MTPAERPGWAQSCAEIGLDLLLNLERGGALRRELDAWLSDPKAQAARKQINKQERAAKRQKVTA